MNTVARASYKLPEEFLKKVSMLNEKVDDIIPRVLQKGAEPAVEIAGDNLSKVIGIGTKEDSEATGDLLKSLGTSKPYQDMKGNWNIRMGVPISKDRKGVSNALKAAVLEYGKHGQMPRPWLKKTKRSSRKACIEVMKNTLDKEIENI